MDTDRGVSLLITVAFAVVCQSVLLRAIMHRQMIFGAGIFFSWKMGIRRQKENRNKLIYYSFDKTNPNKTKKNQLLYIEPY